jgi:PAS domain S-box-containing protein
LDERTIAKGRPESASILLVDDYPANLVALAAVLKPLGHHLVGAGSGQEALQQVLKQDFALIIMDVKMPGMDGFETVATIKMRERSRDIPVIFLSAHKKDTAHVFKGYAHGAVDYLLKPVDPDLLRSKVSVFVELWLRGVRLERKEAELRLLERERLTRESEARYQALLEAIPQGVVAMRPDGSLYYVNGVWRSYCGLDAGANASLWSAMPGEDVVRVLEQWAEARAARTSLTTETRLRRARDGEPRWHLLHVLPLVDGKGEDAWIAVMTDIHDEKLARVQAEAASRAKDEFLATLSHELRNPLNAILGWTRMLRAGKLDGPRSARAVATIERNAEMQAALIEDMLDVSRIITGKLRLQVRAVDLRHVVQAALDTVRLAAEAKQIEIGVQLDEVDSISGDPDRLQQVVWNLLSNAIKFTPRGGHVKVALRMGTQIDLTVSDDGPGISAEFLPFVFDRFRQADSSSARVHGGLGLGLAIVRHLCELHGGTVGVASEGEGRGATFTVRLPRGAEAIAAAAASECVPARAPTLSDAASLAEVGVIVVDDEPDARELLVAVLEQHGARAVAAGSASEALALLPQLRPDVLVSDIGMPGIDGYELMALVRQLAGEAARTPALALTGFARVEDGARAMAAGFDAHMAKPVDPAGLVVAVQQLARPAQPAPTTERDATTPAPPTNVGNVIAQALGGK